MESSVIHCDDCCGYSSQPVQPLERSPVKKAQTASGSKQTAVTTGTTASPQSNNISRLMLDSTQVQPFSLTGSKPPTMRQSTPVQELRRLGTSPEIHYLNIQIERKRNDCRVLHERYRMRQRAYNERLTCLRKDIQGLLADYRRKMKVLDGIEQQVVQLQSRGRPRQPMRSVSMVQIRHR